MNVYEKIHAVMQDVEYLQKDDTVGYGKGAYKAITEEKVTSVVRASLIKHGLVIVPTDIFSRRDDQVLRDRDGNEKVSRLSTVDVCYRIQNIDDPEDYITAASCGTGVDTQDKGAGKAMTYAYKYLLLRTFAIPTGEDPDKMASAEYDDQFAGNDHITERDYKNLLTLVESHGFSAEWIAETTGKNRGSDLTKAEYAEIVKRFNG